MPTTYPGIPVLTDGPGGRQIIPIVMKDGDGNKIDVAYLLRWTPQDELGTIDPDGVWDGYIVRDSGPDELVVNGASRERAARLVRAALRASGVVD